MSPPLSFPLRFFAAILFAALSTTLSAAAQPSPDLTYVLFDNAGKVVDTLGNGTFHGGITIAGSSITIDTSKLTTAELVPGEIYRVVVADAANPGTKTEIVFRVPASSTGLIRRKITAAKPWSAGSRNILGRLIPAFPGLGVSEKTSDLPIPMLD
jgi:hypothetical protein